MNRRHRKVSCKIVIVNPARLNIQPQFCVKAGPVKKSTEIDEDLTEEKALELAKKLIAEQQRKRNTLHEQNSDDSGQFSFKSIPLLIFITH